MHDNLYDTFRMVIGYWRAVVGNGEHFDKHDKSVQTSQEHNITFQLQPIR